MHWLILLQIGSWERYSMNINFVSYLHPHHFYGGGEQYTRGIVEEGERRGHAFTFSSMAPQHFGYDAGADLDILFDFWNCPGQPQFDSRFLEVILRRGRYVNGQCGYSNSCFLAALPCNGKRESGGQCPITKADYFDVRGLPGPWFDGRCTAALTYILFQHARLNCFLSPLHRDTHIKLFGEEIIGDSFLIKPILDITCFKDLGLTRDIEYACGGGMGEPKGYFNLKERFPEGDIVLFGSENAYLAGKEGFGRFIGKIGFTEMPAFLNRIKNYVHLPRWPEPNGLVVNQAALCGCNLMVNDNVGATSWDTLNLDDPVSYENPAREFWERVETM